MHIITVLRTSGNQSAICLRGLRRACLCLCSVQVVNVSRCTSLWCVPPAIRNLAGTAACQSWHSALSLLLTCPAYFRSVGRAVRARPSRPSQYLGVTSVPLPLPPAAPPSEAQLVAAREVEERKGSMAQLQVTACFYTLDSRSAHHCRQPRQQSKILTCCEAEGGYLCQVHGICSSDVVWAPAAYTALVRGVLLLAGCTLLSLHWLALAGVSTGCSIVNLLVMGTRRCTRRSRWAWGHYSAEPSQQ